MPFGQSIVARIGTKAALASIGCDPITQAIASRVVGWTVAHLTLDHHHQVLAEVGDAAHDGYNVADSASDFHDSSDFQRSGAESISSTFERHDNVQITHTTKNLIENPLDNYLGENWTGEVTGKILDATGQGVHYDYLVVMDSPHIQTAKVHENDLMMIKSVPKKFS